MKPAVFLSSVGTALALAVTPLGLGGCVATGAPTPHAQVQMQNNDLEHRVMAALQADRRLQARMFTVSAAQGVVTLGGTPPDMQQRDLALQIAGRVPGVRRVIANMPLN